MTTPTVTDSGDALRVKARRAERFHARHLLWDLSKLPRVRSCGRASRSSEGVQVRVSVSPEGTRTAGYSNVQTCGSVWSCPQCSAKIASGRQGDIEAAITAWKAQGGDVALGTFTVRHHRGHRLSALFDAVSGAWSSATGGRGWKTDQELYGFPMPRLVKTGKRAGQTVHDLRIPTIRVWESTHGDESGWHVHVHALLFLPGGTTPQALEDLGSSMFARWCSSITDAAMLPTREHGVDLKMLDDDQAPAEVLGEYFTKQTFGPTRRELTARAGSFELTRGDLKDAKYGNRTPFAILRGLVLAKSGELDPTQLDVSGDEGLWAEWESSSRKRRQVYWTPGLRAFLLPDVAEELTDEELADAAVDGEAVADIPGPVFRQITRHRADYQVLAAFGRSNAEGWDFVAQFFTMAQTAERALSSERARWRQRS